ncbi:hypothetical protein LJC63_06075 [Ruminococcaceae bacterium OttesenSCG-928-L11]|nr:hypothetical protein [Ruminococcaceae bacterium OttesenSCG-928-L11]
MAMVQKRSGKMEAFDIQKIKNTLAIASDELGRPLGHSDIKLVTSPVLKFVEGKETVTSKEIYGVVVDSLEQSGFRELADSYRKNSGNYWN